jgi:hypothetical protein
LAECDSVDYQWEYNNVMPADYIYIYIHILLPAPEDLFLQCEFPLILPAGAVGISLKEGPLELSVSLYACAVMKGVTGSGQTLILTESMDDQVINP